MIELKVKHNIPTDRTKFVEQWSEITGTLAVGQNKKQGKEKLKKRSRTFVLTAFNILANGNFCGFCQKT